MHHTKPTEPPRLLLDIGNSSITWMFLSAQQSTQSRHLTLESISAVLPTSPVTIRFACVRPAPQASDYWMKRMRAIWGQEPHLAQTQPNYRGLKLAYADPASFGTDRWLGLLALHSQSPRADWLLIDAGTALSLDALRSDGCHLGGLLVPGRESVRRAFLADTGVMLQAKPDASRRSHQQGNFVCGQDTRSCLDIGANLLQEDFAFNRILAFRRDFPRGRIMFAGGDGKDLLARLQPRMSSRCFSRCAYDSHLVCRGLEYAFD